jgi:hypothetical protein
VPLPTVQRSSLRRYQHRRAVAYENNNSGLKNVHCALAAASCQQLYVRNELKAKDRTVCAVGNSFPTCQQLHVYTRWRGFFKGLS